MAQKSSRKKLQLQRQHRLRIAGIGLALLLTVALSLMTSYWAGQNSAYHAPALASQANLEQAKQDITARYLAQSTTNCIDHVTNVPYDGTAYFAKYLHVNAYANRATIRACNTNGTLLTRINGQWLQTDVSLNLNARANPAWAKACLVSDILTLDSKVRSENRSIDNVNLRMCQALQDNKILRVQDL